MTNLVTIKETLKALIDILHFSTIVPAILFVTINVYLVVPTFYPDLNNGFANPDILFVSTILTLLLSYFLFAFNFQLIRILEGYPWQNTALGSILSSEHEKIRSKYEGDKFNDKLNVENIEKLNIFYPPEENILPTGFGNAVAAAEYYSSKRYGIDAVEMWPRLIPILIDQKYSEFISQQKSVLDMCMNLLYLTIICGIELMFTFFYKADFVLAFLAPVITLLLAMVLYFGCINAAIGWGYSIKVAFDIFRNDLSKKLGLKEVNTTIEEIKQWKNLSKFYFNAEPDDLNSIFKYKETQ